MSCHLVWWLGGKVASPMRLVAGKGFLFAERGDVALRGFEDPVRLYEVRWRQDSPD